MSIKDKGGCEHESRGKHLSLLPYLNVLEDGDCHCVLLWHI
jgi:hypothetical protein